VFSFRKLLKFIIQKLLKFRPLRKDRVRTQLQNLFFIIFGLLSFRMLGQNISLYNQYNGTYDFIFIGNTLNTIENNNDGGIQPPCTILTTSSATLNLSPNDVIEKAYLYWAGSGTGDFDVKLNNQDVSAQRTFSIINSAGLPCFSAFNDITALVQATGNGLYTFSDLDLSAVIDPYCSSGGNFGGWAIVIIYKNPSLPINQINVYDGMQGVPSVINITLNSLNVIDNMGAKIGFVAWEGDKNISVNESLTINGSVLQNTLNPANNAFNGTNSFTNSDQLFNMDLDVYDIQNNINIGDTSADIQLTSGQDFVMINCIVTKLNSQLPDATINIDDVAVECGSRNVLVNYTVYNLNATAGLQAGVPIAVYADGVLVGSTHTQSQIPIGQSETGAAIIAIPPGIASNFNLTFVVDDDGSGNGIVFESNEGNNKDSAASAFSNDDPLPSLPDLFSCNNGLTKGTFDLSSYTNLLEGTPSDVVTFFASESDMNANSNPISNITEYSAPQTPATIFVKVDNGECFRTASFLLRTRNCPPTVYNYISANNDTRNDAFFIDGLRDVFVNFKLSIYNRWGKLVWTGDNNVPDWDGYANEGLLIGHASLPTGTYFYALELNDPDYPRPLVGYLYIMR